MCNGTLFHTFAMVRSGDGTQSSRKCAARFSASWNAWAGWAVCVRGHPLTSSSLSSVSTSCPISSPLLFCSSSMWPEPPSTRTPAHTQNEEYGLVVIQNPLTGYEPKLLDNFDYSETSAMIFQDESGDIDTEPSYSCDAELKSAIFTTVNSGARRTSEPETNFSLSSCQKRKSSREIENERIRILLARHKEQILAEVRTEIQ